METKQKTVCFEKETPQTEKEKGLFEMIGVEIYQVQTIKADKKAVQKGKKTIETNNDRSRDRDYER